MRSRGLKRVWRSGSLLDAEAERPCDCAASSEEWNNAAEVLSVRPRAGEPRAAAMDVDRISWMSGVGPEQTPSWTREKMRRKKFVEDVPPEVESSEESEPPQDEDHDGLLDVIA